MRQRRSGKLSWNCDDRHGIKSGRRVGGSQGLNCACGVSLLAKCLPNTHTHPTTTWLRLTEKTSPTEFHGEKWRIAVVAVAVGDDVSVASRSNVALLHCYFILLRSSLCSLHLSLTLSLSPPPHPSTNLQRLTYLTCWHALNRMSDDGRHCSKAEEIHCDNLLRQNERTMANGVE